MKLYKRTPPGGFIGDPRRRPPQSSPRRHHRRRARRRRRPVRGIHPPGHQRRRSHRRLPHQDHGGRLRRRQALRAPGRTAPARQHRLRKTRRRPGIERPTCRRRPRAAARARFTVPAEGRQRRAPQASRPPPFGRNPLPPPVPRQAEDRRGQEDGRLPNRRRQGRDGATSNPTTGSGPPGTLPRAPTPGRSVPTVPGSPSRTP